MMLVRKWVTTKELRSQPSTMDRIIRFSNRKASKLECFSKQGIQHTITTEWPELDDDRIILIFFSFCGSTMPTVTF